MTETKQWMGLHNHDRHFYSPGYGDRCGKCWYCSPEAPCYCCLQAEVEALREKVKQHEVVFKVQAEALKSTREQVQAVRALCQSARVSISKGCLCYGDECSGTCGRGKPMGWNLNPDDILRALDGDA